MRKNKGCSASNGISILMLDDDETITLTLQMYFQSSGYRVETENNPLAAIETLRTKPYDILMLDYLMSPICGDQVVEEVRKFNSDIYIIMLTGHKDMVPPIKTIRELDIQGYFEKSNRFDQLELLVESCVKSIRQMKQIRGYEKGLQTILDDMRLDLQDLNLQAIEEKMLATAIRMFAATGGYLMTGCEQQEVSGEISYQILVQGSMEKAAARSSLEEVIHTVLPQAVYQQDQTFVFSLNQQEGACSYLGLQLTEALTQQEMQLMEVFIRQFERVMDNVALHEEIVKKNQELDERNRQMRRNYIQMLMTLRRTVDAKDIYTRGHSDRVSFYAVKIGQVLGKDEAFLHRLRVGGLFHDIGKIKIADAILQKPEGITREEYEVIKKHPEYGAHILGAISQMQDIIPIVSCHHERMDGKGYPAGLTGDEIPLEARIVTVVDAFDAMVTSRKYREGMELSDAIHELETYSGTQFDQEIVAILLHLLEDFDGLKKEYEAQELFSEQELI